MLGHAFLYLIIKYLRRIWLNWHHFMEIRFPGALSPLAGKSGWLGEYDFPPGFEGQRCRAWQPACMKNTGLRTKAGWLTTFPTKRQGGVFIFFYLPGRSFTAQIQVYSECLRQEKEGKTLSFLSDSCYLPQSRPP